VLGKVAPGSAEDQAAPALEAIDDDAREEDVPEAVDGIVNDLLEALGAAVCPGVHGYAGLTMRNPNESV